MKLITTITILFFYTQAHSQIVPNVSVDTLLNKMFPIYHYALKSGIYDIPRDTSWQELKTYDFESLALKLPTNWLELGKLGTIVEDAFDASGLYFPEQYNNRPILAGVFVLNWKGNSIDDVKDSILKEYRTNSDRIFETNFYDSTYKYILTDNSKAYILHTRFLRKANQLNQSRYDLVIFSDKHKKAYSVMISIQYHDPKYEFEKDNLLPVFAARIFGLVQMK